MTGRRAYNAVFTAETLEPRQAANGKPYLRARGLIANRTGSVRRTVLVQGRGYDAVATQMRVGEPLGLRGFYERVETGQRPGGQFFAAFGLSNAGRGGSGGGSTGTSIKADAPPVVAVPDDIAATQTQRQELEAIAPRPTVARTASPRIASDASQDADGEIALYEIGTLRVLDPEQRPAMPSIEDLSAAARPRDDRDGDLLSGIDDQDTTASYGAFPAAPRTITGHVREGYWRRQWHGKGRSLVKIVWIDACVVKGGRRKPAMTLPID